MPCHRTSLYSLRGDHDCLTQSLPQSRTLLSRRDTHPMLHAHIPQPHKPDATLHTESALVQTYLSSTHDQTTLTLDLLFFFFIDPPPPEFSPFPHPAPFPT